MIWGVIHAFLLRFRILPPRWPAPPVGTSATIITSSKIFLAKSVGLMQQPDMFLISIPRSFHFISQWSNPLDLKGIWPMFGCEMYSGGQRVSHWCERQGAAVLFDLIFSFALLANSLPSMHDIKQHEYKVKCVCVTILSHFLHLSALFFSYLSKLSTPVAKRADWMLAQALSTWMPIKWVRKVQLVYFCSLASGRLCVCVTERMGGAG